MNYPLVYFPCSKLQAAVGRSSFGSESTTSIVFRPSLSEHTFLIHTILMPTLARPDAWSALNLNDRWDMVARAGGLTRRCWTGLLYS